MKKTVFLSFLLIIVVSSLSGLALSGNSKTMSVNVHIKDLPKHDLRLISPSDPSFDGRLVDQLKGESNEVVDALKPFSVFLENKGDRTVVAYLIQWCFTREDGSNQYYRKAILNPQALMEGDNLSGEYRLRSGRIEPNSTIYLSLLATDGSGILRTKLSASEVEEFRQGKSPDRTTMFQRFTRRAADFTDLTVSIDGAFFDDGTFVGPDTSGFFAQAQAVINAKRDLLRELSSGVSELSSDSLYGQVQEIASTETEGVNSNSTPAEYYSHFKKLYANEILQMRTAQGDEKALVRVLDPLNKPWKKLRKKD